jgi:5'-nucleotidase
MHVVVTVRYGEGIVHPRGTMRIQITNDDGIDSVGLQVLARRLHQTEHDIVVVAPDRDWSGASAALGMLDAEAELAVAKVEIDGAPGLTAWALDGPPALTVVAARLGAFGEPPDLVVSGINAGLNTGRSVLHSGTVGAVLTAQNFGISGLAVSVATSDPWQWESAAELAVEVLPMLESAPSRSALNLNVPARPREQVRGIRWGRLAPFGAMRAAMRSVGTDRVQFELAASGYQPEIDTDQGAVDAGFASITTLVGVTEAWAGPTERDAEAEGTEPERNAPIGRIVPGADLHPVHQVPDASAAHTLRRPLLGGA